MQYGGQSGEEERHTRRPKKAVKGNDVVEDLPSASSSTSPFLLYTGDLSALSFPMFHFIPLTCSTIFVYQSKPRYGSFKSHLNPYSLFLIGSHLWLFQFGSNVGLSCSSYNHCKVQILIILLALIYNSLISFDKFWSYSLLTAWQMVYFLILILFYWSICIMFCMFFTLTFIGLLRIGWKNDKKR